MLPLSPQQRRPVRPQTSPARMDSVFLLGGAVTENQSVQTVQTRLMQSAVSSCADARTYRQTQPRTNNVTHSNTQTQAEGGRARHELYV